MAKAREAGLAEEGWAAAVTGWAVAVDLAAVALPCTACGMRKGLCWQGSQAHAPSMATASSKTVITNTTGKAPSGRLAMLQAWPGLRQ